MPHVFPRRYLTLCPGPACGGAGSRKKWFDDAGCDNLDAFNKATGEGLPRLVFACDEVAELLDRTGRSKEDRDKLNQIENRLATLARLGRAFGIHLILATQRPDANILPGQNQEQHGFPGMRQGRKRIVRYHPGQHQRRRTDTQGRKGPFHHRGWDCVPGLPVQRGAAIRLGGGSYGEEEEGQRLRHWDTLP